VTHTKKDMRAECNIVQNGEVCTKKGVEGLILGIQTDTRFARGKLR
jgi:hypothetical protein